MAFQHGRRGILQVFGLQYNGYIKTVEINEERQLHDVTTLDQPGAMGHKFFPGFRDGSLALEGFFENTQSDPDFAALLLGSDAPEPFSFFPTGSTAPGEPVIFGAARFKSYKIKSPSTDMIGIHVEAQAEDPGLVNGTSIFAYSGSLNVGVNVGPLDRGAGAATANRRIALIVHCPYSAWSGGQNYNLQCRHSVDNISYVVPNMPASDEISWSGPTSVQTANRFYGSRGAVWAYEVPQTINRYVMAIIGSNGSPPSPITGQISVVVY